MVEEKYKNYPEFRKKQQERHTPIIMLEGIKIQSIRKMTEKEAKKQGWDITNRVAPVIELENGIKIFPSSDEEGNHVGMLFGETRSGYDFYVFPQQKLKRVI